MEAVENAGFRAFKGQRGFESRWGHKIKIRGIKRGNPV
jgi:hypothetical protein